MCIKASSIQCNSCKRIYNAKPGNKLTARCRLIATGSPVEECPDGYQTSDGCLRTNSNMSLCKPCQGGMRDSMEEAGAAYKQPEYGNLSTRGLGVQDDASPAELADNAHIPTFSDLDWSEAPWVPGKRRLEAERSERGNTSS